MTMPRFRAAAALLLAIAPLAGAAAQEGGGNTTPPEVIAPQIAPPPQTPLYPPAPIGTESAGAPVGALRVAPRGGPMAAPVVGARPR
ncbi:MAG: hypothetical protein ABSG83_10550 [Roseiarcus sp.]|jgi:hypothetical protein